jgi:Holliday junction resolvase RusA-like endonuclease
MSAASETVPIRAVSFVVDGISAPQGSKTRTRWGMREDNPNTAPWRNAVATAARAAMAGGHPLLIGPLELSGRFYFPRPKSHYRTGRFANELKPNAPVFVQTKPDLDKLVRAIGDACKGIVYRDDSEIARLGAVEKLYGPPRAEITLRTISEDGRNDEPEHR